MKHKLSNLIKSFFYFIFIFVICSSVSAKEINLYEQPKTDAKVVSKIDLSTGIIPIFTPKEGDWIKVADPRNGNVGWIKSSDFNGSSTKFTFTQRIINDGKGPHTYQIIQYGQPQTLNDQQIQEMVNRMQMQQLSIQHSMQKIMQDMMNDMNNVLQHQWNMGVPIIMPVTAVPEKKPLQSKTQMQQQQIKSNQIPVKDAEPQSKPAT